MSLGAISYYCCNGGAFRDAGFHLLQAAVLLIQLTIIFYCRTGRQRFRVRRGPVKKDHPADPAPYAFSSSGASFRQFDRDRR